MSTKSVLCAVDVSNTTRDLGVYQQAEKLAAFDGAQLSLITVVPDYGMSVVGTYFDANHHEKAVEDARGLLQDLVKEASGADAVEKVNCVVATGSAYEEILNAAKADKADLIVIGAHKPDFRDFLLGPNAARVVRHSECSVYVVR